MEIFGNNRMLREKDRNNFLFLGFRKFGCITNLDLSNAVSSKTQIYLIISKNRITTLTHKSAQSLGVEYTNTPRFAPASHAQTL